MRWAAVLSIRAAFFVFFAAAAGTRIIRTDFLFGVSELFGFAPPRRKRAAGTSRCMASKSRRLRRHGRRQLRFRIFGVVIFMATVRNLQCSSKVNSPCAKVYLIRYNKFRKLKRKFLDSVEFPAFLCKRGKRGTSCKRVQSLFSLSGLHTAAAGNSDCRCGGQTVRRSPPPASRTTGPGRRSHTGRFRGSL